MVEPGPLAEGAVELVAILAADDSFQVELHLLEGRAALGSREILAGLRHADGLPQFDLGE